MKKHHLSACAVAAAVSLAIPVPIAGQELENCRAVFYDYNGDGKMERLYSASPNGVYSTLYIYNYDDTQAIESYQCDFRFYSDLIKWVPGFMAGQWAVHENNSNFSITGFDEIYMPDADGNSLKAVFSDSDDNARHIADIDNDGQLEIIQGCGTYFTRVNRDGTLTRNQITSTIDTTDVYVDYSPEDVIVFNPDGIPSLDKGWMINGPTDSEFSALTYAYDITGDGIKELIDTNVGGILYSLPEENKYFKSYECGTIIPVDFNDDGMMDYVMFDRSSGQIYYLAYNGDGYEQQLLFTNGNISDAYCHDFDRDGDIDIVLPMGKLTADEGAYLIFFTNDGNGNFKKAGEKWLETNYEFFGCYDVDADGLWEIIASPYSRYSDQDRTVVIKCNTDFSVEENDLISDYSLSYNGNLYLGDVNLDGITEYYVYGSDYYNGDAATIEYSGTFPCSKPNTAPARMEKPAAAYNASTGRLKITWQPGRDAETSACDLTYELRIGTAPGLCDILYSPSLATGARTTLAEGNMGRALYTLFDAEVLAPGNYYISVQAVDAGNLGSPWSEELVYHHSDAKPRLSASACEMASADTLTVTIKNPVPGATYAWNTGDGRIIATTPSTASMVFSSTGEKSISVTMTGAGYQAMASDAVTVHVAPAKYTDFGTEYTNAPREIFVDWDCNGVMDGISYFSETSSSSNARVSQNDGNGNFEQVRLSYNTDLDLRYVSIVDFNRDGYPDFLSAYQSKGNVFINNGNRDFDFTYYTHQFDVQGGYDAPNMPEGDLWTLDTNHDGFQEILSGYIYFNHGDNTTYTAQSAWDIRVDGFYDVNRDGFADMINKFEQIRNGTNDYTYNFNVMLKDSTSNQAYCDPVTLFSFNTDGTSKGGDIRNAILVDLNNDGLLDIVWQSQDDDYHWLNIIKIVLGHKDRIATNDDIIELPITGSKRFVLQTDPAMDWFSMFRDFDNNGYVDLLLAATVAEYTTEYYIMYMYPNLQFKIEPYDFGGDELFPFIPLVEGDYPYAESYRQGNIDNAAPERPGNVAAVQTPQGLLITWDDARDDHTPAVKMRYNVSVKKKGATGEDSFLISPMNGLDGRTALTPNFIYTQATRYLVPADVLEAGQTYEVQVQAIDLWTAHSPMTEPVEVTINADGCIDMPERAATGRETTVRYAGTGAAQFSCDPGKDGTVVSTGENGTFGVKWSSKGTKTVTITADGLQVTGSIIVGDPIDVDFELPAGILAGAPVEVKVPESMADATRESGFRTDNAKLHISYAQGDSIATMLFTEPGSYTVESFVTDSILGNTCTRSVTVSEVMPEAAISSVAVDGTSGLYVVNWPTSGLPLSVKQAVIYKETNSLNVYMAIDTVQAADGKYADPTSQLQVKSERYKIAWLAINGQESYASEAHKPLHVMINTAAAGGFNLMWNQYEGLQADYYTIMRGTSAAELEVIAQIAGSQQNYTDTEAASSGTYYYAVTMTPIAETGSEMRYASQTSPVASNVACTTDAIDGTYAEQLSIRCVEPVMALTDTQGDLHLYAEVLPLNATFSTVRWEIVNGEELARISRSGILSATGNGNGDITVRASAIDGSGLYAEAVISCEDAISSVTGIKADEMEILVACDRAAKQLTVSGLPADCRSTLQVVAVNGLTMQVMQTASPTAVIDYSGYPAGFYILKVTTADHRTATAKLLLN